MSVCVRPDIAESKTLVSLICSLEVLTRVGEGFGLYRHRGHISDKERLCVAYIMETAFHTLSYSGEQRCTVASSVPNVAIRELVSPLPPRTGSTLSAHMRSARPAGTGHTPFVTFVTSAYLVMTCIHNVH